MTTTQFSVSYTDKQYATRAQHLATKLTLELIEPQNDGFVLCYTPQGLALQQQGKDIIYVDFLQGKARHRRLYGGTHAELIARACGIKAGISLTILDATAGLGSDAFVLATRGCHVTMLERSPIIHALLEDGLQRLQQQEPDLNLQLLHADAFNALPTLSQTQAFDTIYLDPMHPVRSKSALVKKDMRLLRSIVGDDIDGISLFQQALIYAKKRVVVKRPRLAQSISSLKPTHCYQGKSIRFDVYIVA